MHAHSELHQPQAQLASQVISEKLDMNDELQVVRERAHVHGTAAAPGSIRVARNELDIRYE